MSDGVAARAGTIRARLAFSMVAYIFAYRAIIGAFSISGYVTGGATVIANHHGVDARQRTVQALSCLICSQYSQSITAWTRDTERCTNQNPELNENESDPDFLCVTIACPSMTAAMRRSWRTIRSAALQFEGAKSGP